MSNEMVLDADVPIVPVEVWEPRYHDNVCLILAKKVKQGRNFKVWFSKANSLKGKLFYVSQETIKKYPKESNGSDLCYAVPMDALKPLRISERRW